MKTIAVEFDGVIHNGSLSVFEEVPGAFDALKKMHAAGNAVAIVTMTGVEAVINWMNSRDDYLRYVKIYELVQDNPESNNEIRRNTSWKARFVRDVKYMNFQDWQYCAVAPVIGVCNHRIEADCYISARALKFDGVWKDVLRKVAPNNNPAVSAALRWGNIIEFYDCNGDEVEDLNNTDKDVMVELIRGLQQKQAAAKAERQD